MKRWLVFDAIEPWRQGGVDESLPDLDPTDELPAPRPIRTVRYSARFGEQVRGLGGIEAEAALIAHLKEGSKGQEPTP